VRPSRILPTPGSNLSTTVDDYVIFSFTNPNGTALTVWYTGPQGNLTQDCSGAYPLGEITCTYEPSAPGTRIGPYTTFFKTTVTGNYTIHLLSTQCTITPNCSTTTAIGTLTLATSSLTYNRPYWALGLATVIVVGASIAAIAYLATSSYREHRQRAAPRTRS